MTQTPTTIRPRRRWWQVVLRVAAVAALALTAAYVSLPWWLPTGMIRDYLAKELTRQTRLKVDIGGISLSWKRGVEVTNLVIHPPQGFSVDPMVSVELIRTDFSPLDMALDRRIGAVELVNPCINLEFNAAGQANLSNLVQGQSEAKIGRISVRQAVATVYFAGESKPYRLNVSDFQVLAGVSQPIQSITMSAALHQGDAVAPISLGMAVGAPDDPVAVRAAFHFVNVNLAELNVLKLAALPLRKLGGACSGSLELQMNRKLVVERFQFNLGVRNLDLQPVSGLDLPVFDEAFVRLDAAYDILNRQIEVSSASVRLPGADLSGKLSLALDSQGEWWTVVDVLSFQGEVTPAPLASLLTGRRELPYGLDVRGTVKVGVNLRREGSQLAMNFSADATGAAISRAGRIAKPAERKLSAEIATEIDERTGQFTVHDLKLALGENSASGSISIPEAVQSLRAIAAAPSSKAALGLLERVQAQFAWQAADMQALRDVAPEALAGVEFRGKLTGRFSMEKHDAARFRLSVQAPAESTLKLGQFDKGGRLAAIEASGRLDAPGEALRELEAELALGEASFQMHDATVEFGSSTAGSTVQSGGRFQLVGVDSIAACLPSGVLAGGRISGQLAGGFFYRFDGQIAQAHLEADASRLAMTWKDAFSKEDGEPAEVSMEYACLPTNFSPRHEVSISAANSQATVSLAATYQALGEDGSPVEQAQAKISLRDARWLTTNFPAVKAKLAGGSLAGSAEVGMQAWRRADGGVRVHLAADGANLSLLGMPSITLSDGRQIGPVVKPAGAAAEMELEANISSDASLVQLNHLQASLGEVGVLMDGRARFRRDGGSTGLESGSGHASVWTRDADSLAMLLPSLTAWELSGDAFADVEWRANGEGAEISSANLQFESLRGRYRGKDLLLRGNLLAERINLGGIAPGVGRIMTDGLEFRIGRNHGFFVADLSNLADKPMGEFSLMCDYLDDKEIADWISGAPSDAKKSAANPPARPAKPTQPASQSTLTDALRRANEIVSALRTWSSQGLLLGNVRIDHYVAYDANVRDSYDIRQLDLTFSLERGHVLLVCDAGLNGGSYRRRIETYLGDPSPLLRNETDIQNLIPTKKIQPQLARQFPGNTVYGLFSRNEESSVSLTAVIANAINPKSPAYPIGKARTVAINGMTEGRAAPIFVTHLFPGLNLAKYRYDRMTGFAEMKSDGTTVNDMVFNGQAYDIYMEGTTDAGNIGNYEIGLILLGTPQTPEFNHTLRQGRIPILKFRARIEDGRLYDEEVSYPWPNETLFTMFLKNNVFYRIWLEAQRPK